MFRDSYKREIDKIKPDSAVKERIRQQLSGNTPVPGKRPRQAARWQVATAAVLVLSLIHI